MENIDATPQSDPNLFTALEALLATSGNAMNLDSNFEDESLTPNGLVQSDFGFLANETLTNINDPLLQVSELATAADVG